MKKPMIPPEVELILVRDILTSSTDNNMNTQDGDAGMTPGAGVKP